MYSKQQILIDLLSDKITHTKIGIIIRDITDIDPYDVVKGIHGISEKHLHAAFVGYDQEYSKSDDFIVANAIEKAVEWRSVPEYAGSILVFIRADSAKTHSLNEFDVISTRDLSEYLLSLLIKAENNMPVKSFWQGLTKTAQYYSYDVLEGFVNSVVRNSQHSDAIPKSMWILGLLIDDEILGSKVDVVDHLNKNRDLIEKIGQLSEESRRKLSKSLVQAKSEERATLQEAYRLLQEFFKYGQRDTLKRSSYSIVSQLFSASRVDKTKKKKSEQDNDRTDTPTEKGVIKDKEFNQLAADALVELSDEDKDILDTLYQELKERFDDSRTEDTPEIETVGGRFEGRSIDLGGQKTPLRKLIGQACSNESWGGVLETRESVLKDAITADDSELRPFDPLIKDGYTSQEQGSLFEFMGRFDSELMKKGSTDYEPFEPIIERLRERRAEILEKLDLIMYYPILSLGTDEALRNSLIGYIDAWSSLLKAYCENEPKMHTISSQGSSHIAHALLYLDTIYIKTPNEWKGMLTPLHPLYLWRYYEIFKNIDSYRDRMDEKDAERLKEVISSLPNFVSFLVVDRAITGENDVELPCSGSYEMLPTFENKTNRYLGNDGLEAINEFLSRWLAFAPYSRFEVRVCTIDVPDMASVMKTLCDYIGRGDYERIVYESYFTRNQNANSELAKIDYDSSDHEIAGYIRAEKLTLNIVNAHNLAEVTERLKKQPVHLAFFFDQSTYSIDYGPSTQSLYISPLVISYNYEYDEITKQGKIFPASDVASGMIGDYYRVMRHADIITSNHTPRPVYNHNVDLSKINSTIEKKQAQWLIVADRTTTAYAPQEAIPIGEMHCGHRAVNAWAAEDSRIIGQYLGLLNMFNLYPQKSALVKTLGEYGHISAGGLVSIPRFGANMAAIQNQRKGLIGTVFAASWYQEKYENALVASLDSKEARLWLSDNPTGKERADLIGLRFDEANQTLYLQSIEVKTRDDAPDGRYYADSERSCNIAAGRAADQIATTVGMLKEIFKLKDDGPLEMFISARKEVLKYQIITECFRNIHDYEWQSRWSEILKEAFKDDTRLNIVVTGMLIHVNLSASYGGKQVPCKYGKDLDCHIDWVELTAQEIQNNLFQEQAYSKGSWEELDHSQVDNEEDLLDVMRPADQTGSEEKSRIEPESEHQEKSNETATGESSGSEYSPDVSRPHVTAVPEEEIRQLAREFMRACPAYKINIEECRPERAVVGSSVIRFYFRLSRGQSLDALKNKLEDIGREMKRTGLIIQTISNSDELILDVPKLSKDPVLFSEVVDELPMVCSPEKLFFTLGRTPNGEDIIKDLGEIPHMLIGGSTGSGKTVFLFTLLVSLLKTHPHPEDMKLLISSAGIEDFIHFEGLPHLIGEKIVTDAKETTEMIKGVVSDEFERRARIIAEARVPNIIQYNEKSQTKLAPLVVIIDEFADIADQLGSNAERDAFFTPVRRIAQIGRKRGIHLVLCTQRPSANLVPTDIKAQLNGRLALRVNDAASSRMILDEGGAQLLQKHGDMIYKNGAEIERAQGYLISTNELVEYLDHYK